MNSQRQARQAAVRLHREDNVATALRALHAGEAITVGADNEAVTVTLRAGIALCHKFAVHGISAGSIIRKYGETIGEAREDIAAGDHVHVHNLLSLRGR